MIFLTLLLLATGCYSFPTGAPTDSCSELLPKHPKRGPDGSPSSEIIEPQTSPSPFKLEAKVLKCDLIEVTLSGDEFRGFILRPFDEDGKPLPGKFSDASGLQTINCGEEGDTATHTDRELKKDYNLQWNYPDGCSKDGLKVVFKGSVVKSYDLIWKIESEAVSLKE
ncbi:putative defense protein [Centruroides vittatus]|uniref:putative defense protein n=1 Tax=Centruroides vittatus TaxID=120091 RepID=UPI00350E9B84